MGRKQLRAKGTEAGDGLRGGVDRNREGMTSLDHFLRGRDPGWIWSESRDEDRRGKVCWERTLWDTPILLVGISLVCHRHWR